MYEYKLASLSKFKRAVNNFCDNMSKKNPLNAVNTCYQILPCQIVIIVINTNAWYYITCFNDL